MATKIHSHLKHFIHQVILAEMATVIGPSKTYAWKEALMKRIQEKILEDLDSIQTQEQLNAKIDEHIVAFAKEIEDTLKMISRTLKGLNIAVLRRSTGNPSQSTK